jgi:hypothetical protein
MNEHIQIEKSISIMQHYAYNTALLIYRDYLKHRSYEKLAENLIMNFTKRNTDEIKSYRLYLIAYFTKRNIPFQSLSIKLPDMFMQKSLTCYSGTAEFKRKCETCFTYADCDKIKRFKMIFMQLIKLFRKQDMLEDN